MPKLWVMSDLHFESFPFPGAYRPTRPEFDILVAAGDIWQANCRAGFLALAQLAAGKPIVFVMGNHEHWNGVLHENLSKAKAIAQKLGVTLLNGEAATIGGCRFAGATLWTDYCLAGATVDPGAITGERIVIADEDGVRAITVADSAKLHGTDRTRLETLIQTEGSTLPLVVVTHHAPHPECLPKSYRDTWKAGNSASDLSYLTDSGRVALWVHGHIHENVDMIRPNGTRVLCNPAGPRFANPDFNESLVIRVG